MEEVINLVSKAFYYIAHKEGYSYLVRTLYYDVIIRIDEEATKAMT